MIKEKVDLNSTRIPKSYIWHVNGCTYERFDSGYVYLKFEPNQIGPGSSTIMRVFHDEAFQYPYSEDSADVVLLKTIALEPNYGTSVRLGYGVYAITIPDTVTSDSVAVTINYELFHHGCWHEVKQNTQISTMENNEYSTCLDCTFPDYSNLVRYTGSEQLIIKPDSFVVYIDPPECYPGDTVQVVIKKRNADGTLADFPPEQTYEIAKLEGCLLGNILAENDSGSYFYDISQPIYFAAADTLVGDTTGIVLLQVGLLDNEKKKELPAGHSKIIESNDCFYGGFQSVSNKKISFNDNKIEIVIISPTIMLNEIITNEPRMPEVICKANLNTILPFNTIKYEWKYIVRKFYERRGQYTCIRISRSEFQGLSYSTSGGYTEWTVPFDIDSAYFYFKSIQPQKAGWDTTSYHGCLGEVNYWYDTSSDDIFTGGEVMITLIAKDYHTGKEIARADTIKLNKILGTNPSQQAVWAYTNSNKMKAIIWKETAGTFAQFLDDGVPDIYWWPFNEKGWPLYGYPNGIGLSQLDNYPSATERQMWNWKANVDRGKTKLQDCYDEVFENHGSPNDFKANWTNAFHNYNHGNGLKYYVWKKDKKGWKESNQRDDEYGKEVYEKYKEYEPQ